MTDNEFLSQALAQCDIRTFAAIMLRVPQNKNAIIDEWITQANKRDGRLAVTTGVLGNTTNPIVHPGGTMNIVDQYNGLI